MQAITGGIEDMQAPIEITQGTQGENLDSEDEPISTLRGNSTGGGKRKRKGGNGRRKKTSTADLDASEDVLLNILDEVNAKCKVGEKRTSAKSHFNYFLELRNHQLLAAGKEPGRKNFDDLTFFILENNLRCVLHIRTVIGNFHLSSRNCFVKFWRQNL